MATDITTSSTPVQQRWDDSPGAWFKRGFFVGLGVLAAGPVAVILAFFGMAILNEAL